MRRTDFTLTLVGIVLGSMPPHTAAGAQSHPGQTGQVVAHASALSQDEASIELQLSSGESVRVTFLQGSILVELAGPSARRRDVVAQYEVGGPLETAWRGFVGQASRLDPGEMLAALQAWRVQGLSRVESAALQSAIGPFAELTPAPAPPPVERVSPQAQSITELETDITALVGALEGLEGLAALRTLETLKALELRDRMEGLQQLEGLEQLGGLETLQDLQQPKPEQPGRTVLSAPTDVALQVADDLLGLIACFIALGALGFGLSFFAPRPLEVVADTVYQSFWRSFIVGLLAQPLVIPAFGMLLLGLVLTVIGIILIPFAIVGFVIAVTLAILGGYIAVARSVGEAYLRRRMSLGHAVGGALAYRYVVYGLVAVMAVWVPAVLLGWIPLAGTIATASALIITWMLATAGLGAAILSHAGIRGTFGRRLDQALTDEHLYHTPPATPVVRTYRRDVGVQ
jgi:hypothetical protein